MTAAGWLMMIVSWSAIIFWTGWCFRRVLISTRHWTKPEEDIALLRHGEFGEPTAPGDDDPPPGAAR